MIFDMGYKTLKILILTVVTSVCALNAKAQTDTAGMLLFDLKRFYNAGKYFDARKTAEQIRQNGKLSSENYSEYLKYYSSVLRESGFESEADSLVRTFVTKNPFYETVTEDPLPFKEMFLNYYAYPKFSVGFSAGICAPKISVDTVHVVGENKENEPSYEDIIGYTFDFSLQYRPIKTLSVLTGIKYRFAQYSRTLSKNGETGLMNFDYNFVYKESVHFGAIPLYVGYAFDLGKWTPEIFLGGELNFIMKADYEAYNAINTQQNNFIKSSIDLKTKNRINGAISSRIRISRNYNRISVFADFSKTAMLKPHNNPEYNYSDNNLFYNKLFVPDAISFSFTNICVGVKINFGYGIIAKYGYGY